MDTDGWGGGEERQIGKAGQQVWHPSALTGTQRIKEVNT